jgi:predicted transcriptional regulator
VSVKRPARSSGLLEALLGPLELRALEALWRRRGEAGVRALHADFPGTAYTTLMTTLDRLYKKELLRRRKHGRAYLYAPRYERPQLETLLARDAIEDLLRGREQGRGPEPVLSGFVEAVGRRDARMLDELERLVRHHKNAARRREPR